MMELLKIIRETENEQLTAVAQKFVSTYPDHIKSIASEICQHLVSLYQCCLGLVHVFEVSFSQIIML